jgi:hypothetical protein
MYSVGHNNIFIVLVANNAINILLCPTEYIHNLFCHCTSNTAGYSLPKKGYYLPDDCEKVAIFKEDAVCFL